MYYLHVLSSTAEQSACHLVEHPHGPFTSEQEAKGFVTKLSMWYPGVMQDAECTIVREPSVVARWHHSERPRNAS
jgi:hypothetical protein